VRTLLLNDGSGILTPSFVLDSTAASIAAGDFNADGLIDLVAQGALYLNDGQFARPWANQWADPDPGEEVVAVTVPIRLSVADVDGDGNADVVTDMLYLGDGAGGFTPGIPLGFEAGRGAPADIDGDGDLDIVSASCTLGVSLQDAGAFSGAVDFAFKTPWLGGENEPSLTAFVGAADIDGDGIDDVSGGSPGIGVLFGAADAYHCMELLSVPEFAAPPTGVAFGDFNGDGATDAAAVHSSWADVVVFLRGVAKPSCPADLDGSGAVDSTDLNVVLLDFGCVGGACSGDIDGDGDADSADLNALLAAFGGACE
jgi:hypothetical protein